MLDHLWREKGPLSVGLAGWDESVLVSQGWKLRRGALGSQQLKAPEIDWEMDLTRAASQKARMGGQKAATEHELTEVRMKKLLAQAQDLHKKFKRRSQNEPMSCPMASARCP